MGSVGLDLSKLHKDIRRIVARCCRLQIAQLVRLGADEDDLLQDVLTALVERNHLYDPSRGAPSTWVSMIARQTLGELLADLLQQTAYEAAEDAGWVRFDDEDGCEVREPVGPTLHAANEVERLVDEATADLPERERVILRRLAEGHHG